MDTAKECITCKLVKDFNDFYPRYGEKQTLRNECKKCWASRNNKNFRDYHLNFYREDRRKNPDKYRKNTFERKKAYPEKRMLARAKSRAKKRNLEFDLSADDIIIPDVCPALGIKLELVFGTKGPKDQSPSLDRIDNTKGYTKENIRVISFRANSIKKDANIKELDSISAYMKNTYMNFVSDYEI